MVGRKPTPTHLKIIKGTARQDRINAQEAKISMAFGKPEAPAFLTPEARTEWNRQCDVLWSVGILTHIDGVALACYCQAYGRWQIAETLLAEMARHDETSKGFLMRTLAGSTVHNPVLSAANKAMADTMRYAVEMGMTPSARSRITAEPPSEADKASKYLS